MMKIIPLKNIRRMIHTQLIMTKTNLDAQAVTPSQRRRVKEWYRKMCRRIPEIADTEFIKQVLEVI